MPFNNTPDPAFFFATPEHEEALAALCYGVSQRRGMILVTGKPGSGKTMLGRILLESLRAEDTAVTITHTPENGRDLLQTVCRGFGVRFASSHSNGELIERLHATLATSYHDGGPRVIVLDEAQNISLDVLDNVGKLGNLETATAKLLQIVFLGQPELLTSFCDPRLEQLRQRLFCARQVNPLNREQTHEYMRHRLKCAGAKELELFSAEAVDLIHERAGGIPRIINQIADNAMLSAFGESEQRIDRQTVAGVLKEMMSLRSPPRPPPVEEHTAPQQGVVHAHGLHPVGSHLRPVSMERPPPIQDGGLAYLGNSLMHLVQQGTEISGQLSEVNRATTAKAGEVARLLSSAEAISARLEAACKASDDRIAQSANRYGQLKDLLNDSRAAAEQLAAAAQRQPEEVDAAEEIASRLSQAGRASTAKAKELGELCASTEAIAARLDAQCHASNRIIAESADRVSTLTNLLNESTAGAAQLAAVNAAAERQFREARQHVDAQTATRVSRLNASLDTIKRKVGAIGRNSGRRGDVSHRSSTGARSGLKTRATQEPATITGAASSPQGSLRRMLDNTNQNLRRNIERLAERRTKSAAEVTTSPPTAPQLDARLKELTRRIRRINGQSPKRAETPAPAD